MTTPEPTPERERHVGRIAVIVAASVVLVLVAVAAFSIGRLSTLGEAPPADTSAEAGFARDMQVHHQQGVELAMMVRDITDDPEVRLLAYDIATTQAQQAGQMYGWLRAWGLPQAGSEPAMAWMMKPAPGDSSSGHSSMTESSDSMTDSGDSMTGPGALMPGMATPEQIAELRAASGVEAERIFLTLMTAHHQGAVEMAQALLERSSNEVVTSLAQTIVESQTAEIKVMEDMLAARS